MEPDKSNPSFDASNATLPWEGEEREAKLYDYYEGATSDDETLLIERYLKIIGEPLREELAPLSLKQVIAPTSVDTDAAVDFAAAVEQKIYRRSGGRFFGKRTWLDMVPVGALLVIALITAAAVLVFSAVSGSDSSAPAPAPTNEKSKSGILPIK